MNATINIFSFILDDSDFQLIDRTINELKNLSFDRLLLLKSSYQNPIIELAKAILNLEEIITNSNCHGYLYNSFLLNSSMLQLLFLSQIIHIYQFKNLLSEKMILDKSINSIISILDKALESNPVM